MLRFIKLAIVLISGIGLSPAFADISHGNGYSSVRVGNHVTFEDDNAIIEKVISAFGRELDEIETRADRPSLVKADGKPIGYIFRDAGEPRGERPALRRTTIAIFNQEIPQSLRDLAISEFGASAESFAAFPMGIRFSIREIYSRRDKKTTGFKGSMSAYRTDPKRDGNPELNAFGNGIMVPMPDGIYKHKTKFKKDGKGVVYTLYGPGEVAPVVAKYIENLEAAGFETSVKANDEDANIKFNNASVEGAVSIVLTTTKTTVNVLINVRFEKCKGGDNFLSKLEMDMPEIGLLFNC